LQRPVEFALDRIVDVLDAGLAERSVLDESEELP